MKYNYIIDYDGKSQRNDLTTVKENSNLNYLAKVSPVEIHMHGIDTYDFSEFNKGDLPEINEIALAKHLFIVITGFLEKSKLKQFQEYMTCFIKHKEKGALRNILGIALEGPLLSSTGGTPTPTTWLPNKKECCDRQWSSCPKNLL